MPSVHLRHDRLHTRRSKSRLDLVIDFLAPALCAISRRLTLGRAGYDRRGVYTRLARDLVIVLARTGESTLISCLHFSPRSVMEHWVACVLPLLAVGMHPLAVASFVSSPMPLIPFVPSPQAVVSLASY